MDMFPALAILLILLGALVCVAVIVTVIFAVIFPSSVEPVVLSGLRWP